MKQVKKELAEKLSEKLDVEVDLNDIERPEPEHGDFAYPVMKAASELGENPRKLAEETAGKFEDDDTIQKVDVAGPGYVNFHLDNVNFAEKVFEAFEGDRFGIEGRDGKVLVEFSQPNMAKPMHVGHFRNNALGDSLQRIMRFVGYDVTSENYIGDWGTQYGKLIYAFKKFGSEEEFQENPMEHMYSLYVKFHKELEEDEEIEEKGREWAARIEEGDEEAVELWEKFREASMNYHKRDYERMGIDFDRVTGESKMVEGTKKLLEEGLERGIIEEDEDGSLYIEFDELPDVILQKDDGTTLYLSRDLENLRKRIHDEGFDYNLYVVASPQDLHFEQAFKAAEKLGYDTSGCEHISYGLLSLPEGSMSSREGRIVGIEDALDEAEERAREKAAENMEREVGNAEAIGIGALKYANLSVSRSKDIEFSWDRALSFEGNSGPYLQYSNTRAKSILREADKKGELLGKFEEEEYQLLKKLSEFPEKVERAADDREPAKIANYLSELCEEFNSFYHSCKVLGDNEKTEKRRLRLVEVFVDVSDQGLELLGIEPLKEM